MKVHANENNLFRIVSNLLQNVDYILNIMKQKKKKKSKKYNKITKQLPYFLPYISLHIKCIYPILKNQCCV